MIRLSAQLCLSVMGCIFVIMGFLFGALDLALKAQHAPNTMPILSLVDFRSGMIQAGILFAIIGLVHFGMAIFCDHIDNKQENFLDKDVM